MLKYLLNFFKKSEQVPKSDLEKKIDLSQTGILDMDCDVLHRELIGLEWEYHGDFYGNRVKTTEEILKNHSLLYQN